MAATAGQIAEAGRIPGERIATSIETSDSSTFTTSETALQSVTAAVVSGRTYRVKWATRLSSSVANDQIGANIREDSVAGAQLAGDNIQVFGASSTNGWPFRAEVEYTADATESKTFVATGTRISGSGNCFREAASNRPSYLYVDYIRG